jgi:hypothetical protein
VSSRRPRHLQPARPQRLADQHLGERGDIVAGFGRRGWSRSPVVLQFQAHRSESHCVTVTVTPFQTRQAALDKAAEVAVCAESLLSAKDGDPAMITAAATLAMAWAQIAATAHRVYLESPHR